METLEKFDLKYNCRFSTYAYWHIRRNIDIAIIRNENIKKPKYVVALENKIYAYCYKISQEENRNPTEEELCKVFNISLKLLKNTLRDFTTTSLNQKLNEESDEEIIEFIESEDNFIKELEKKELRKIIIEEMEKVVTPEMLDMVIKNLGFYDGDKWVLERIAKEYGISRQAVNKKIESAYRRIRKSKKLKEIIEKY